MTTRTEALILEHFAATTIVEPKPTCTICHDTGEVLALIINLGVDGDDGIV